MIFHYTFLLAILSSTLAATTCKQPPNNFLLYTNTTGNYGALGGSCTSGPCGLFFSVTHANAKTHYNLTSTGQLIISRSEQPTKPIGLIAFGHGTGASIEFGTRKRFAPFPTWKPLKCSIKPAPATAGGAGEQETCNLVCVYSSGGEKSVGNSYDARNNFKAYLGEGDKLGTDRIEIRVDFDIG